MIMMIKILIITILVKKTISNKTIIDLLESNVYYIYTAKIIIKSSILFMISFYLGSRIMPSFMYFKNYI